MRKIVLVIVLVLTVAATYVASTWPELLDSYSRWQNRREEEAAAPQIAALHVYSSLARPRAATKRRKGDHGVG